MKHFIKCTLITLLFNACYYKTDIHQAPSPINTPDFEDGVNTATEWFTPAEVKRIKTEINVSIPTEKPTEQLDKLERKEVIFNLKNDLLDRVETAKRIDKAVSNMVKLAVFTLKKKGLHEEAKKIEDEYLDNYQNYTYLYTIGALQDIGDHPPMWEWLDKLEKNLREKLGDFIMQVTRLEDLKTFNYGIPVVLQPAGDERFDPPVLITKLDYSQHFIPFAGALSYWAAWGTCVGATFGAGAITFICAPAAMIVERVVETKIAPPLSDEIWERANN